MGKLSIKDVMTLPMGTKVHMVYDAEITTMQVLIKNPKNDIFYFVSNINYRDTISTYIPNDNYLYFTDYELAKEEMWNQLMEKVSSINGIYFNGSKTPKQ